MAELEDVTLDGKPLNSLRVADLKAALEKRGLPKSGQKNALIKRLKGALMLENLQKTSTPHIGLQPNSQIGAEMSQNSFIQQYLAKQQELLRQRLEREALDAAESKAGMESPAGEEEEDNSEASDHAPYRPEHSITPARPLLMETHEERGLGRDGPPRAVASLSVRVVGDQLPAMHIPQVQESQSTTYAEAGSAQSLLQRSRFGPAASQPAQDDSDDDDDDDDSSEEDEEWGPGAGKRGGGRKATMAPQYLPTPQRSRRKLQPPQHIPPQPVVQQPPLQLRQPTPPPSPPLEMSFPLPDTPKQSPPDLNQAAAMPAAAAAAAQGPPVGLQRQDSSSSSRSSSPEPPAKLGRGPLSLLVRKMESEGAFEEEMASAMAAGQQEGAPAIAGPGLVFPGGAPSSGGDRMVSSGVQSAPLLPQMSEAVSNITFSSGLQSRGVITTLVESEKSEHLQSPSEKEMKRESEQKRLEDVHAQQTTSTSTISQPLAGALVTSPPSTAAPPLPVAKRRFFSDVPPPISLLLPNKAEPTRSDVPSAISPPAARATVLFSGLHQTTTQPLATEGTADAKLPKQVERRQMSEGSAKPPSLLPPSPPPDESEARRKGRGKEQSTKRPSSDSSSSDSSDSGSSDSGNKSPLAQKKGKQEQRRPDGKGDGSRSMYREVKQSALSESADAATMELMEGILDRPGVQGHTEAQVEHESSEELPDKTATVKGLPTRKISLSSSKTSPGGAEGGLAETDTQGGVGRKRRWGSSTSVTTAKKPSISLTTDSLKSLIPDIKSVEEAVVELHPEDGCLSGDEERLESPDREPDLKIRRTVTQVVPSEDTDDKENGQTEHEEEHEEAEERDRRRSRLDDGTEGSPDALVKQSFFHDTEDKKATPSDSLIRRSISQQKSGVSVTIDDPVQVKEPSPPRRKATKIIHVRNLVRPFTIGQLKELLSRTGTVLEDGFWIDKIKSHCYVTYATTEEAVATRSALHGVKWPLSNPKVLSVDFCEQDELDFHKGLTGDGNAEDRGQAGAPGAGPRPAGPPPLMANLERGPAGGVGNLERGVRDQWAEREREMQRRERTRSEREWDRDKVREFSKAGEEREGRRSRSRDRERRRRERGKSQERKTERKGEEKKAVEEPPAKLLDDLFRKTKATPCIYWLPLSDEQAVQRDLQRAERKKERERRQKELEEQEEKKQQEEKKERAQGRHKEGGAGGAGGGGATATPVGRPGERERERERPRNKERERERDQDRERGGRDGDRRVTYRSRGAESRPSGGSGASRRSRSRSNPPRDRWH